MKITVITVCYNSEKTIERAIQSVLEQDYNDLEYLVIDGSSSDNTLEILERYKDKISLCISEPDHGIYDAMNKGLGKATGEVVAFLNSDDWYAFGALKKVEEYFQKNKADIVSGNIFKWKDGKISKAVRTKLTGETIFFGVVCPHPAMFVKRKLFLELGGFDTSYKIAADTKWTANAYLSGAKILCVEDCFTYFSVGGVSTTQIYETVKEEYEALFRCAQEHHLEEMADRISAYYIEGLKNLEKERSMEIAFEKKWEEIRNLFDYGKTYYIWGAGKRGNRCLHIFEKLGLPIQGFIDSGSLKKEVKGYPLIGPEEIKENCCICITPKGYEEEIKARLETMGIETSLFFTFSQLIDKIAKIGAFDHKKFEDERHGP